MSDFANGGYVTSTARSEWTTLGSCEQIVRTQDALDAISESLRRVEAESALTAQAFRRFVRQYKRAAKPRQLIHNGRKP